MEKRIETLGIIGGGQLGRMTAIAAPQVGVRTHVWAEHEGEPGTQVADMCTIGPFDDAHMLNHFLRTVDAVTVEFENVSVARLEQIEQRGIPVRPSSKIVRIAQDRWSEKYFFNKIGEKTTPTQPIENAKDLEMAATLIRFPAILKTRRDGYDGHGQIRVRTRRGLTRAWKKLKSAPCVLEELVDLAYELSVIVARDVNGTIATYQAIENTHENGILRYSRCPGPNSTEAAAKEATRIAIKIAKKLELVGVLAIEFFVTKNGEVLVNEMAPRPHNSGHGTIEGCETSQFLQHVLTTCGLPVGPTTLLRGFGMKNLLGDEIDQEIFPPGWIVHRYGKKEARPGRKMGHVTQHWSLIG